MSRIVFLLEEECMKNLLEGLLPRFFPKMKFLCIKHNGKQDLEKSIPRKLRAWNVPNDRFVIIRDNDNGDCRRIKKKLVDLCIDAGREDVLVRIACQELESWYLGDLIALAEAYDVVLPVNHHQEKYRQPDRLGNPSEEVKKLIPAFQKCDGARRMGRHLHESTNKSESFNTLLQGLSRLMAMSQDHLLSSS